MNDSRIILKSSITRDDVSRCAWQNNWELYNIYKRSKMRSFTKTWVTVNRKSEIHYIEDFKIDGIYILIRGENLEKIAAIIHSSLNTYTVEELCQLVQTTVDDEECIRLTLWLGAAATTNYDERIFHILRKQMSHDRPDVRKAAIFATTYLGWKEWNELLKNLIKNDLDSDVRDFANSTLKTLRRKFWYKKEK